MRVPFSSFVPLERELEQDLRDAFDKVFRVSWYIDGKEDQAFEKAFGELMENILKYADSKAVITLRSSNGRIKIGFCNDTGLKDGEYDQVFDRFVTLENAGLNEVSVYDLQGRLVSKQSVDAQVGEQVRVSTEMLNAGMYFISVSNNSNVTTAKLVVK